MRLQTSKNYPTFRKTNLGKLIQVNDLSFLLFALHIIWVMVPMGQYTHQLRGLNRTMVISPRIVEVSITL